MKDFLNFLAKKRLFMNISEQKYYVRQKKTRHFCRVNFSLMSGVFTPPELVSLV